MKILNWEAILWDCMEEMKNIPDGSIDCIITDPPYWTTACKWDSVIPFDKMWERLNKLIKPNGAIVLFWSEPFSSALRMSNIKNYKYDWIWEKNRPTWLFTAKKQPMKYHELIHIFYNKQPIYNPIMWEWTKSHKRWSEKWKSEHYTTNKFNESKDTNLKYPKSILKFDRKHPPVHPTQKPVALMEYLIKTYTNEWELVLDFTAWSFTTAVACENTNRHWICIEKEKEYFNIGIERLNKHSNK
jgi:DNA modification methylase